MEKIVFIYYLHKGDNIPFYIGKTINPQNRLKEHKSKKYLHSILEIIDEVNEEDYIFWESHYISLFKSWGFILENKNNGGGGGKGGHSKHTEESKKSIGNKNRKPKPIGYKEKLKDLMKNGLSKKISESNKGISRNKGRKITWDNSKPSKIYEQYDINGNFIKKFIGYKDFENTLFNINGVYRAIKENKIYKEYYWKKLN